MNLLNDDIVLELFSYLNPCEIIALYESCGKVFENITNHIGFIVNCQTIVDEKDILWFQNKNICLNLLRECILGNNDDSEWYFQKPKKVESRFHYTGPQKWFLNGKLHSENDQPAKIRLFGTHEWYKNGLLHRNNDLPAVVNAHGSRYWYQNGKKHRDHDLPAFIGDNCLCWYQNGLLHRDGDMPARIVYDHETKCVTDEFWCQNGLLHRDGDKPALICSNGLEIWCQKEKLLNKK